MPQKRSGGFWIAKAEFEELLDGLAGDRVVGVLAMRNATAAEVRRVLVRQDPQIEKLPVEEHDQVDYVVHLGAVNPRVGCDPASTWLDVREFSPIYRQLRRHHRQRTKKTAGGTRIAELPGNSIEA